VKIQNGISIAPPTPEAKAQQQDAQLRDAAQMYETHFLNQLVKSMRSTVGSEDGLIKRNMAEKIFTEQLDQKYVEGWAQKGGVGLADMIYQQIRSRYLDTATKKDFTLKASRALPLNPGPEGKIKALPPSRGTQMEYRMELNKSHSPQEGEVRAPLGAGKVSQMRLEDNWNLIQVEHDDGIVSELAFPGTMVTENGSRAEPGQKLGQLDQDRPVLFWRLNWS